MRRFANGFTLIEVIVVVAIVALLAAVAIPIYLQYVNRAQVVRAHAELSAYKAPMEEYLSRGQFVVSNVELGFVQSTITLPAPNIANFNPDGSGALEVTLGAKRGQIYFRLPELIPELTGLIAGLIRDRPRFIVACRE